MRLGRVIGNVVSTIKVSCHNGCKLMVVELIDENKKSLSTSVIAIDAAQSGIGDIVLLVEEGGSSRAALNKPELAVDCLIIGIVDKIEKE